MSIILVLSIFIQTPKVPMYPRPCFSFNICRRLLAYMWRRSGFYHY